ncbi:hypothetical protein IEQ34_017184 [Dendrobium chrysotoxum]|uniref:Cytochrome P450 n=1 Tax=Dendrobium chrysotoxum TaxID=161865 RepID=A0AAV7G9J7_DENCH|nr:hypothetical protein IEQ34_017184 [Dendrobium chrysotoxum]
MALPLLPLLLLLTSLLLLKYHIDHRRRTSKPKLPPGPPRLPIIGNLHLLHRPLHRLLSQFSNKYGPLMFLQLGVHPAIVISSAEMAKKFIKNHDQDCCSRPSVSFLNKLSFGGADIAFAPYGEQWRELRKICSHEIFSLKKVSSFRTLREEEIEHCISSISDLAAENIPVNLTDIIISLGANMVTRIALGRSYHNNGNKMHEILQEMHSISRSFFVADFFPRFGWIDVVSGLDARVEKFIKKLDDIFEEVISEHLDPVRPKSEGAEDILDTMLGLLKDPTNNFTMNNVKGVLMDIFVGGTDTPSLILEWAMAELIRNPQIMKKAQDEVRSVVKSKGKVEETDIQHLHYFKMILKEILRLYPPGPLLIPNEALRGFKVDEYDIQPKTRIIINAWAIGREATYWERPEEFFPERFINNSIDTKGQDFQLIPFGSGRRMCPGMNMGMTLVEIALANLLYAFNWDLIQGMSKEDIDLEEFKGSTLKKMNPLILMASRYTLMQG